MEFVWLIVGFILLIKGADWMVQAASRLAKSFGISLMVIGLTVVALGTSMPEVAIGVMAAIKNANQLTLGDVVGSSVANIALIIGFSAILIPLKIQPRTLSRDIPLSILIQVLFIIFLLTGKGIDRLESSMLLFGFVCFLIYLARSNRTSDNQSDDLFTEKKQEKNPVYTKRWIDFLIILIGIAGVAVGSKLIVDNSILIATSFGLSEAMIGVTIVALGTSLPELVVSIVSISRKEHELLIGNIIGSNVFNILLVIGISGVISPIAFDNNIWINLLLMLITSLLFFILAHRNKRISRPEGIFFLCFYLLFLILAI